MEAYFQQTKSFLVVTKLKVLLNGLIYDASNPVIMKNNFTYKKLMERLQCLSY